MVRYEDRLQTLFWGFLLGGSLIVLLFMSITQAGMVSVLYAAVPPAILAMLIFVQDYGEWWFVKQPMFMCPSLGFAGSTIGPGKDLPGGMKEFEVFLFKRYVPDDKIIKGGGLRALSGLVAGCVRIKIIDYKYMFEEIPRNPACPEGAWVYVGTWGLNNTQTIYERYTDKIVYLQNKISQVSNIATEAQRLSCILSQQSNKEALQSAQKIGTMSNELLKSVAQVIPRHSPVDSGYPDALYGRNRQQFNPGGGF